jgi:hypothetical protein
VRDRGGGGGGDDGVWASAELGELRLEERGEQKRVSQRFVQLGHAHVSGVVVSGEAHAMRLEGVQVGGVQAVCTVVSLDGSLDAEDAFGSTVVGLVAAGGGLALLPRSLLHGSLSGAAAALVRAIEEARAR